MASYKFDTDFARTQFGSSDFTSSSGGSASKTMNKPTLKFSDASAATMASAPRKLFDFMAPPSATTPSTTTYWTMATIMGLIALAIKYCDINGLIYTTFPQLLNYSWFPGLLVHLPMMTLFVGMTIGWIAVRLDDRAWYRPQVWLCAVLGYWVYVTFSGLLLPAVANALMQTPLPVVYLNAVATSIVWCAVGMLTLFVTVEVAYRKLAMISANLVVSMVILILAAMFLQGFLVQMSQAILDPLPPELVQGTAAIIQDAVSAPNPSLDVLAQFQFYMTSEQGRILALIGTFVLYWVTMALALQGMVTREH